VAATAAAHGGRVSVHSREPSGATFTVHLPLAAPSPSTTEEAASPARDGR
jgi:signal transduction histidine kinase